MVSNLYAEIKLIVMSTIKIMCMANIGYIKSHHHGISVGRALSFLHRDQNRSRKINYECTARHSKATNGLHYLMQCINSNRFKSRFA